MDQQQLIQTFGLLTLVQSSWRADHLNINLIHYWLVSPTTSNEMLLAHIYWILPIGHIIKNLNIFSQQIFWL